MSVGVLHVRCGRGITRCLSDIVGRRVAQPAGISLGKVKNAPRNAGDLSGFLGDSWRAVRLVWTEPLLRAVSPCQEDILHGSGNGGGAR